MQDLQESSTQIKSSSQNSTVITLDVETTGLDWQTSQIILNGYRLNGRGEVIYARTDQLDSELNNLLRNPANTLRGHNVKFDALSLYKAGYDLNCELEDTRLLAYLRWPLEESHSLKDLVRSKLNREVTELSDLMFTPLKRELPHFSRYINDYWYIDGSYVRKDLLKEYHKQDVLNVDRIRALIYPTDWFYKVEKPLTKILFESEKLGCHLDQNRLEEIHNEFQNKADSLREEILKSKEININSGQQVAEVLISLGHSLPKTAKGSWQTDASTLKTLAWAGCAYSKNLLEYRRLNKILTTYILPFIERSRGDGRLHGSFNQAGSEDRYGEGRKGTNTGRLSSAGPNLQNIPSRTKEGKKVRSCFTPTPGFIQFNTDLRQIEPRLVGHKTQSPKLIEAFKNGLDTHGMFASDIFGKEVSALTVIERFIGKTSWLATYYGCGYHELLSICERYSESDLDFTGLYEFDSRYLDEVYARRIKQKRGPLAELANLRGPAHAKAILGKWLFLESVQTKFKEKNPELMAARAAHIRNIERLGYVTTIGGRRIDIPNINSYNPKDKFRAERQAVNYEIQGSAADILKIITIRLDKEIVQPGHGRILAYVHDEILGELKDPKRIEQIHEIMCNTVSLNNIKIDADTKILNHWGEKK